MAASSTMNQWLLAHRGRQLRTSPADELVALDAARVAADSRGDSERVAAIDRQLDQLFEQARQLAAEEHRASSASARFSSGVRRPIVRRPSVAEQANRWLAEATGRARIGRYI
jgi:hypothetical protein